MLIEPYETAINGLISISSIESPMCKIEQIYHCCTSEIQSQVDQFWQDYEIPKKELRIDADNLQSIYIYMISRLNYPHIWTELHFAEEFLPKAVKQSNRLYYLTMMQASCEYLIKMNSSVK